MNYTRDTVLDRVFGVPQESNTTHVSFTGTATATALVANQVYRLIATEDCYITIEDGDVVTAAGVLLIANNEYMVQTTSEFSSLSTIQVSTAGTLVVTKMLAGRK